MTVAGRGLVWPGAGGCWLPVWLPLFVSAANLQQRSRGLKLATAPAMATPGAIDHGVFDVQPRGLRRSAHQTAGRHAGAAPFGGARAQAACGICQPELGTVAGLLLSGGLFVFGRVDPGGSR